MTNLSNSEAGFLGVVLESIFYGGYAIIFALYLNISRSKGSGSRLVYPLSAMFILCTCFICLDFTQAFLIIFRGTDFNHRVANDMNLATSTIYSIVDATSQGVLIYRCWIMWGKNLFIVILPSLLTLVSFVTSIILVGTEQIVDTPVWFFPMGTASFSISLSVNTIVTALLIWKLVQAHGEVPAGKGKHNLRLLISMLIESGMLTFVSQLTWVVLFQIQNNGLSAWGSPLTMIYGITPTVVLVRVSMGRSNNQMNTTAVHSSMHFTRTRMGDNSDISTTVQITTGEQDDLETGYRARLDKSTENLEKNSY
ncbi:hypothetical protein GALMADRAFT_145933 [Galerina marginata CBS 339.88]|uniref:Uncharacterized protein n=1 Tax=Galerina marginata (strain CBS 339.88) TaxID=685588 RepID=A0A067SMJ0_GALM3|nr:hypothetical protein GALMADRAFT_145933 [Galerina marginata CBS 339.88]